jgi:hypothetical protein
LRPLSDQTRLFSHYLLKPEPAPVGANVDPLGLGPGARLFPEMLPEAGLGVVIETSGDETVGIVGIDGTKLPTLPVMGNTPIIGTAAAELTPRLLISVEPNGIPVRAAPPGVVGDVDVGVDDEAMLLEPEPHAPDNPDVSSVPTVVDGPDVADVPDVAVAPDVAAVAGAAVPAAVPPPS